MAGLVREGCGGRCVGRGTGKEGRVGRGGGKRGSVGWMWMWVWMWMWMWMW